jgi:hypothetical protein
VDPGAEDSGGVRLSEINTEHVYVDVARTALHRQFFDTLSFDSPRDLLAAIDRMHLDVDTLARSRDIRFKLADGWLYWLFFTKGYLQYRGSGRIEEGNVYYDYLVKHFLAHGHNPACKDLENPEAAAERVIRRYHDFDLLVANAGADFVPELGSIRVTVSTPPPPRPYLFYSKGSVDPVLVRAIDGWHRMCSARICGIDVLRCEVIEEDLDNKPINGVVEAFSCSDGRLVASGWWLNPEKEIYNYELRLNGRTIANGIPVNRPDIKAANQAVPHADRAGFAIDCSSTLSPDDASELVLVGLQDIIPIGVLRLAPAADEQVNQGQEQDLVAAGQEQSTPTA